MVRVKARRKREPRVFPVDAADDEYLRRAVAAWYRGGGSDWPANTSGSEEFERKRYVVLRNVNGVMAVYRIRNDGVLKRLKRWPKEVE